MSCCQRPVREQPLALWRLLLGTVLAGNSMLWSLVLNTSPMAPSELQLGQSLLFGLTALQWLLLSPPLWAKWHQQWQQRRVGIEMLFLTGMLGATVFSVLSWLSGENGFYLDVVGLLLLIYAFGDRLKQRAQQRAQMILQQAWTEPTLPCYRIAKHTQVLEQVPVAALQVGDCIKVFPGQTIPTDGTITLGSAFVEQTTLTGEPGCTKRTLGEKVYAGTSCVDSTLQITVSKRWGERTIDAIAQGVLRGLQHRSQLEQQLDRFAYWFVPFVLLAALATALAWGWSSGPWLAWRHGMAVLLVACPCALGFATPLALWIGMLRLSRLGLQARGTASVERLASITMVALDKTGTLTQVSLSPADVTLLPTCPYPSSLLLTWLQAIEGVSHHPIAQAFAQLKGLASADWQVEHVTLLPAVGLRATISKRPQDKSHTQPHMPLTLTIGEPKQLLEGIEQTIIANQRRQLPPNSRPLAVLVDGQWVALIGLGDMASQDCLALQQAFLTVGVQVAVLSGDLTERVSALWPGQALGGMTPAAKQQTIAQWSAAGQSICFVGDGLNDAWAMAASQTSIVMAAGAPLARKAADFMLNGVDLTVLPEAIALARDTLSRVRSNLLLAALANAIGMGIAAMGWLHPVFATVWMLCTSLTVTWRSMLLLRTEQPQSQPPPISPKGGESCVQPLLPPA